MVRLSHVGFVGCNTTCHCGLLPHPFLPPPHTGPLGLTPYQFWHSNHHNSHAASFYNSYNLHQPPPASTQPFKQSNAWNGNHPLGTQLWRVLPTNRTNHRNGPTFQKSWPHRFSLLGWRISKHKLLGFDSLCKVLQFVLDLRQSGDQLCFV